MKVLGFDVGIKNLAYCVVENDNDGYFNIVGECCKNWNIINLTEQNELSCANEGCTNSITKTAVFDEKNYYFCTKHKSYHKVIELQNAIDFKDTDDANIKCECIKSCKTKSKWIYNGVHYCAKHKETFMKKIIKERELKKYKTFVKDFSIHDLKLALLTKLDDHMDIFLNVDTVCIENQPVFRNPTMKAISDVMYTWFLMRGFIEKEKYNSTINKLTFFAPSNKMKINNKEKELNDKIDNAKNKYKKTKNLAIEQCSEMINHKNEFIEHLNKFKKKDDMCDAYLHGVYYIQKEMKLKKNKNKNV